eukprot:g40065.t1
MEADSNLARTKGILELNKVQMLYEQLGSDEDPDGSPAPHLQSLLTSHHQKETVPLSSEVEMGPDPGELGQSPGCGSGWSISSDEVALAEATFWVWSASVGAALAHLLPDVAASGYGLMAAECGSTQYSLRKSRMEQKMKSVLT